MKQPGKGKFDAAALCQFGETLLVASGLADERARDVAEVLLEGDLLGHTTHGFAMLPGYLKALKNDTMEKRGEPVVVADHGAALTWDGRYLPGPWLRAARDSHGAETSGRTSGRDRRHPSQPSHRLSVHGGKLTIESARGGSVLPCNDSPPVVARLSGERFCQSASLVKDAKATGSMVMVFRSEFGEVALPHAGAKAKFDRPAG